MKLIKFDLPINGIKVKNLEELRDNLTDEILVLARSSQLERWLRTRQLPEQAQAVAKIVKSEGTDKGLFLALCKVLEVEAHPDDVKAIFDAPLVPGRLIFGVHYAEIHEEIKQELGILFMAMSKMMDRDENRASSWTSDDINAVKAIIDVPQTAAKSFLGEKLYDELKREFRKIISNS